MDSDTLGTKSVHVWLATYHRLVIVVGRILLLVGLPGVPVILVEMFKAHLVMIQRKSANPSSYAGKTEKGARPGGSIKAPAYSSQPHLSSNC